MAEALEKTAKIKVAKVAVSAAAFAADHTYTYSVPDSLADTLAVGMRVLVSYGRRNRRCEAMVLDIGEEEPSRSLKPILETLESEPVFDAELVRLALLLRDRCFCTYYDAVKAMLPSGIWYAVEDEYRIADAFDKLSALELCVNPDEVLAVELAANGIRVAEGERAAGGKTFDDLVARGVIVRHTAANRIVGDKTVRLFRLAVSAEDAQKYIDTKKQRSPMRCEVVKFLLESEEAALGEITYFTGATTRNINDLKKAGIISEEKRLTYRRPELEAVTPAKPAELNAEQSEAYDRLCTLAGSGKKAAALLYGVTGSGKTQVYIELAAKVLESGRGAMILAPEIALTPQLMRHFRARFGDRVAILHSALTVGERADEWRRIRAGVADVVLGTRSAVFAPIKNLGLIVIDEEQERSYKSENSPRYHARDIAALRVSANDALLVLGSATPSVESFNMARQGRYELITLRERYASRPLPSVEIVDMRAELRRANPGMISSRLRDLLAETIAEGRQAILFINRRGAARRVVCAECGYTPECPNCSSSYTYHSANRRLMCHYCGASEPMPDVCPDCGGELKLVGAGTQKVESELEQLLPGIRVLRMDSDTTSARHSHEDILSEFRSGGADVLLGTQMIAKGLDFENVTLVGVLNADSALYADDFRANERTFSIITQVVGRAGRGSAEGRAVLQTYTPDSPIITAAARQDYEAFFGEEIRLRERLAYPPFRDLVALEVSSTDPNAALDGAMRVRTQLRELLREHAPDALLLGPTQAAVFRVAGRSRYRLTVAGTANAALRRVIAHTLRLFRAEDKRGCSIFADISPNDI